MRKFKFKMKNSSNQKEQTSFLFNPFFQFPEKNLNKHSIFGNTFEFIQ